MSILLGDARLLHDHVYSCTVYMARYSASSPSVRARLLLTHETEIMYVSGISVLRCR